MRKEESEWIEIVNNQLASGMKPSKYCSQFGIEYKTFIKARARIKARKKIEKDLQDGTSFIDKVQNRKKTAAVGKNYTKLIGSSDAIDEISSIILDKTRYILNNELNKFINIMGNEKDLRQINVSKLKDLSVAVLKTVYTNNIQKRKLELEIIRTNIESEKLLIEKEKLLIEKRKLGLVKDESNITDNGFVEALKQQENIWTDDEE